MLYKSASSEETLEVGKMVAKSVKAPCIVLLTGDLGAGKTVFAKGFVSYFVKGAEVVSPTFSIVNSYDDTIFHFDLYRLESEEELYMIGAEEYFYSGKICLVEWPERVSEGVFPKYIKRVKITKTGEDSRIIEVED